MTTWAFVRYARNGDVALAYTTAGQGDLDVLLFGGFVSHLEIGRSCRWRGASGIGSRGSRA